MQDYLQSKDIEIYFPTLHVKPVNPRSAIVRPYFPRYLFARTDLSEVGVSMLRWVPGAVQLVEYGGEPAVVSDKYIRLLKEHINAIVNSDNPYLEDWQHGNRVRIKQGPFAGYEALFDIRLKGQDRARVLIHWLGSEIKAKVNVDAIENQYRR